MADSIVNEIYSEINRITNVLVKNSFTLDQNWPVRKENKIVFNNFKNTAFTLKDNSYIELYSELIKNREYNLKFIDGSLVQMLYKFDNRGRSIAGHILSFYPNLSEYYLDVELLINEDDLDNQISKILNKQIIPFPLRFDYSQIIQENHPASHLTLGNYTNCRIPVSRPISPKQFILFILNNFYSNTGIKNIDIRFTKIINEIGDSKLSFQFTISKFEKKYIHLHHE